ncbi:MAG TPA: M23 family metallopeptidase [Candidatus Acidoferrales bacterium]|nr:M23 family metallopeptidase [Candidatus Acidoferrales bacterium]
MELQLSSSESSQGSLLLVEVHSASSLAELKAEWVGHTLSFWRDANRESVRRALLGVDLQRPAGEYPVTLAAQLESGEPATCRALISVKAGRFATEKLRVGRKFVKPSPKDLERAEQERQRLGEIFARVTPERLWQGGFRLPVEGARATGNFGRRRVLNGQAGAPHSGEDFPAATGTPVHAAQSGRVVLAEELFFSGNTVVLDHGLGLFTFYGHLESIAVASGEAVETGTILGRVGATGRVTGPHLHWAVRLGEARVSPLAILALPAD